MNKTITKLAVIVFGIIGALVLASTLAFNAVRHVLIKENEALVHSVAQSLLPALLANDTQQVDGVMKALEKYPGVQSAELISAQGASLAIYSRAGESLDSSMTSFELASADNDPKQVHVMAPITFDSLIVANLHIAVNLWPTYLHIITWLGFLLIVPSVAYVLVKHLRLKIRFEIVEHKNGSDGGGALDVKNAVKQAMNDADISLEFQPIQRMSDGGLFGMEAVVCWRHPSGQTLHVSPSEFVSLADKAGICLAFDDWLLTTACSQASAWQHLYGPLILTINISATQFKCEGFAEKVREVCKATQYPHQLLELEVNEAVIGRQPQHAMPCLLRFTAQGLSVTVDNFGLLQSSMDLLEVLPISKIKLDRKLIKRLGRDEQISELIESIITKAVANDVQVMADGLEAAEQQNVLQRLGCIFGQGAHFNPPLTADEFEEFLAGWPFDVSTSCVLKMNGKLQMQKPSGFSAI